MNEKYEDLLEQLNLVYRLKEQAEHHQSQSELILRGMRAVLEAQSSEDLYQRMFDMFSNIVPYELVFILEPDAPGFMHCTSSNSSALHNTRWEVDSVLKKVVSGTPTAIFNAQRQPSARTVLEFSNSDIKAIIYCPIQASEKEAVIAFGHTKLGFYTQEHVELLERFSDYTTQTLLSVEARLKAMESEQLRQEKERAEASLLKTEKMASIGLLAAGVAHEINNPIGFVSSNLSFLEEQVPLLKTLHEKINHLIDHEDKKVDISSLSSWYQNNKIGELIDEIYDICEESKGGIQRVNKIVSSLKTFTHTPAKDSSRSININGCIQDTLVLVTPELKHKAKVKLDLQPTPLIEGDHHKLGQVLINLLVNAGQAVKNDGIININSRFCEIENRVLIDIKDNGIGISATALNKIFDPFYTTKDVGEGTGLGLYISFSIIQSMEGELSVTSKVNIGTCFTISLPAKEADTN